MRLRYIGAFGQRTGYARAGLDYLKAIRTIYPEIELDIQPIHEFDPEAIEEDWKPFLPFVEQYGELDWPTHLIVHSIPYGADWYITDDLAPPISVKRICMTTWETQDLPETLAEKLNAFNQIIVPSQFCADVMTKVDAYIDVVPHCFWPERWPEKDEKIYERTGPFTFLWVGLWGERKNPIGLLKAYLTAFDASDNVKLIMKTGGGEAPLQDYFALLRCLNLKEYPAVEFVTNRLTEQELIALHHEADCYISLHRGEGFCLGAFESAMVGNPLIYTKFGPIDEFADWDYDYAIDYNLTPAVVPERATIEYMPDGKIVGIATRIDPGGLDGKQYWAEPNLEYAQEAMRNVVSAGRVLVPHDRVGFSYTEVAKELINAIA